MGMGQYVLDEKGNPVECHDIREWGKFMENPRNKILKKDSFFQEIDSRKVKIEVSTVFLGLDHGWSSDDKPVLWETMIFGGPEDQYQDRYSSMEEALKGHRRALFLVGKHDFLGELGS